MATMLDIVTRALRKAAITPLGMTPDAAEAEAALTTLNDMLHGWKLRGVDISHSDLTLTDTFPLADEFREGAVYHLASRISPDYMLPQSFDADDFFRCIQAAYAEGNAVEVTLDSVLVRPPSRLGWYY